MNVVAFDSEFGSGKDNPVVVADDDSNQVFEIAEFLERRCINVVPAFDGESAIAAIEKHRPAVALILMSGDSEAIVRANRNHEGAFAVIEKPLAMKHVAHFIEAALLRDSASR